jgi:hypothetical protein
MRRVVRELRRQIAAADVRLQSDPADTDAKKARISAVGALAAATVSRAQRRRSAFLREMEELASGGHDTRDAWQPLTLVERLQLMPVVMDMWFLITYYTGLRDRLRCPRCTAIGTWKMHGTWYERWRYGDIALRRWGCKYCGHWVAKGWVSPKGQVRSGRIQAFPLSREGLRVWAYPDPSVEREPTPAETVHQGMGRCWPWAG